MAEKVELELQTNEELMSATNVNSPYQPCEVRVQRMRRERQIEEMCVRVLKNKFVQVLIAIFMVSFITSFIYLASIACGKKANDSCSVVETQPIVAQEETTTTTMAPDTTTSAHNTTTSELDTTESEPDTTESEPDTTTTAEPDTTTTEESDTTTTVEPETTTTTTTRRTTTDKKKNREIFKLNLTDTTLPTDTLVMSTTIQPQNSSEISTSEPTIDDFFFGKQKE